MGLIVAAVAAAVGFLIYKSYDSPAVVIKNEKKEIIRMTEGAKKKPLTEAEKKEIFSLIKGSRVGIYQFSDAEMKTLIQALSE